MAKQRTSFAKLQRDRAKAAKKAAKQAKVQGKTDDFWGAAPAAEEEVAETEPVAEGIEALFAGRGELSAPELLQMIDEIHAMKLAGTISADEFEDAKIEIFTRLPDA